MNVFSRPANPFSAFTLAALVLGAPLAPITEGADGERRKFIESLFRSVIESQIDQDLNTPPDLPPGVSPVPARPIPARPLPGRSPAHQAFEDNLAEFSGQAARLSTALSRNTQVQGARSLVPQTLKLKSGADVILARCRAGFSPAMLTDQYRGLDSSWRTLSHQLRTLGGLDDDSRTAIEELDAVSGRLCRALDIVPQIDRQAVLRSIHMQAAYIDCLLDAVDFELHHRPDCQDLLARGRRLRDQLLRMETVALNESYDRVVAQYANYSTECRQFCAALYPMRNRAVERSLARLRAESDAVFGLLWVEPTIDRAYLQHLSDSMVGELTGLFDQMNVVVLSRFQPREQQAILQAGNQLLQRCRNYCGRIRQNDPVEQLVSDFFRIEGEWRRLHALIARIDTESVVRTTRAIDGHCSGIREILGVHSLYHHERALSLAASLEDLSGHLLALASRYGRYCSSAELRNRIDRNGGQFLAVSRNLHRRVALQAPLSEIQGDCEQLLTTWEILGSDLDAMPRFGLSPTRHRYIATLRQDTNPVVAELAMMFTR